MNKIVKRNMYQICNTGHRVMYSFVHSVRHTTWNSRHAQVERLKPLSVSSLAFFSPTLSLHVKFIQGFLSCPLHWGGCYESELPAWIHCFRSFLSAGSVLWCVVWHEGALSPIILPTVRLPNSSVSQCQIRAWVGSTHTHTHMLIQVESKGVNLLFLLDTDIITPD